MPGQLWTEREIEFVKSNHVNMTCPQMAESLAGRTTRAVQHLCNRLGLEKPEPKKGDEFERLTIISDKWLERKPGQAAKGMVRCRCQCDNEVVVRLTALVQGRQVSCGCWRAEKSRERTIARNTTHGLSDHPLYGVWAGMLARCKYESQPGYKNYGGKGVQVCDAWAGDFKVFYDWAIAHGWEPGLTIERDDTTLGYNPENCRIATTQEQSENTSRNVLVTAFGETKTISQWARDLRCAVSYHVLWERLQKMHWDAERAISAASGG